MATAVMLVPLCLESVTAQDPAPPANPGTPTDSPNSPKAPETNPQSDKSSLKLPELPRSFVIDDTRFYSDEEESELKKKVAALRKKHDVQIAIVASPGAIGETIHSDANKKLRQWFTLRGTKGCVILIHRGTRQVGFASNLHENSPLELPEVRGLVNKIVQAAKEKHPRDYQKIAKLVVNNILAEIPVLLKQLKPDED